MSKRIFILNGHPGAASLSHTLASEYANAAKEAGHGIRLTHLHDLTFDSDLGTGGYRDVKPLEPGLEKVLADITWAEHIVLTTPLCWGGVPAKLKGLFDRILLPGRTFDTRQRRFGLPKPMLSGRTARVIMTSDTKSLFLRFLYGNAIVKQLRRQIFGFIGITPTRVTNLALASHPSTPKVTQWLRKARALGAQAA